MRNQYLDNLDREYDLDRLPGDKADEGLVAWLSSFENGGTDIAAAVARGTQIIETSADFRDADLVLLTDAECRIDAAFAGVHRDAVKRLGFRTHLLLVGARDTYDVARDLDCATSAEVSALTADAPEIRALFADV